MSRFAFATVQATSLSPVQIVIDGDTEVIPAVYYGSVDGLTTRVRVQLRGHGLPPLIVPFSLVAPS